MCPCDCCKQRLVHWISAQEIRRVVDAFDPLPLIVETTHVVGPSCLPWGQVSLGIKPLQWVMIRDYSELVAFKVTSKGFETFDDSKHFSVLCVIVAFCFVERVGREGTRVSNTIVIFLYQDSSRCISTCITDELEGFVQLWVFQHRCFNNRCLEVFKGLLRLHIPLSWHLILGHLSEW